jgi:hypothetical protein
MNRVVQQLRKWWFLEAGVRLVWGLSRWLAVVLSVLALACLADWIYDRYADVPRWLRVGGFAFQLLLAGLAALLFVVRPLRRVPGYDDLATRAERAIPELGHRLVTALQLNRPGAQTRGMSRTLIAEVTREAGEMASRHRLTSLADYRPIEWAAIVLLPVVLTLGAVAAINPSLALVLLKRQALLDVEIPRSVRLENLTPGVRPTGDEVLIKIRVTGEWRKDMVGEVRVRPDGQPEDHYQLKFDREESDDSAVFTAQLPPSSIPFTFTARLADGRLRQPGRVEFEPPPQVESLKAWQLLPDYLGRRPDGGSFARPGNSGTGGDVFDVLPQARIVVIARFTKPVTKAVLIPIEQGGGNNEIDGSPARLDELVDGGTSATWEFTTTPEMIAYRIELTDAIGFKNPVPIRRQITTWVDQPPAVEILRESMRNPDPSAADGQGDPDEYAFVNPLVAGRKVMIIYRARSPIGIGEVNLRYRVIPRAQDPDSRHPRDDPQARVFARDQLYLWEPRRARKPPPEDLGPFVPDLGLFEKSFRGRPSWSRKFSTDPPSRATAIVPAYLYPSPDPANEPADLEVGGRYFLTTVGLTRTEPDPDAAEGPVRTQIQLEPGDRLEVYVEVFDKYEIVRRSDPQKRKDARPAGYPQGAMLKVAVSEQQAREVIRDRLETQRRLKDKVEALRVDQEDIFDPPQKKDKP